MLTMLRRGRAACAIVPGGGRLARAAAWCALLAALGCGIVWWRSEQVRAPRAGAAGGGARSPRGSRRWSRSRRARWCGCGSRPIATPALPPRVRVNVAEADMPAGLASGARVALRARLIAAGAGGGAGRL